jgi:membrane-bound serine protease (ClpP class)
MKRILSYCFFLFFVSAVTDAQTVITMKVDGTINPVSADFIRNGIKKASSENAECLIIHLKLRGLLKSTRIIVSDILESPVCDCLCFTTGHAGSAGVLLHYVHIAMALVQYRCSNP